MISMVAPTMTPLSHIGNNKDSVKCILNDVYVAIIASSMTMSALLLLLHLKGWNLATSTTVIVNRIDTAEL